MCFAVMSVLQCPYIYEVISFCDSNVHPGSKACTAHSKVATDVQTVIENISAKNDFSALSASLQRSPALSIPRPVFYKNYYVGECPDLVFGRKLVDDASARGSENTVPQILQVCIEEVNRRGLEATGIYRVGLPAEHNVNGFRSALLYSFQVMMQR
jgi:hypothetical protein